MEGSGSVSVEITGLLHRLSSIDLESFIRRSCPGVVSIAPERGRATVEFASRTYAESAARSLNAVRDPMVAFSPRGAEPRLRASVKATSSTSAAFRQDEVEVCWRYVDDTCPPMAAQEVINAADLAALFNHLGETPMRASLESEVARRRVEERLVIKELYLAVGRSCELVFAGERGRQDTVILRSSEKVLESHLDQFRALFGAMPAEARRTGIDNTLHRISRSIHAVSKRATAVTARVGRTIQGTVLPMLVDSSATDPLEALAQMCSRGLLIIGQPNVGKTTVLRELARLLAERDKRVVVIVDKSMEIAGTGVVPHEAIGNARVLTVDRPTEQDRVNSRESRRENRSRPAAVSLASQSVRWTPA